MSKSGSSHSQRISRQLTLPTKIISGGQTGVDRAGLDVAIALGIGHGGWCPAGRLSEDGSIPSRYELQEMASSEYPPRTEQNVIDSDATLILYEKKLRSGTLLTRRICDRLGKAYLLVRLEVDEPASIADWLAIHQPATLNIAGPRESSARGIYDRSFAFLINVFNEHP
ncbi:putative molybdenum carrier [Novipirellula galeiformis]|uniref:Putative molybdenum carrier n=1 Tax=Novipirellula galeiformis TaxID=2528004 RepID=A0A5C6CRR4_9BACT|nr:putative molybdenum carrier protein [Novipirellula galeiformis]TWU26227.1 putative molybdenum carrier [Novipirellula galeiformis]